MYLRFLLIVNLRVLAALSGLSGQNAVWIWILELCRVDHVVTLDTVPIRTVKKSKVASSSRSRGSEKNSALIFQNANSKMIPQLFLILTISKSYEEILKVGFFELDKSLTFSDNAS